MKIILPPTLIPSLKNKHLLLDTNIFRDALKKPALYNDFFNELKKSGVTLITTDQVKYELLKGSSDLKKYQEREDFINRITDGTNIPLVPQTTKNAYDLLKLYGVEGASLDLTDLYLGSALMLYKKNIFLMSRDTNDFIQDVFDLVNVINVSNRRGIITYGIYQYLK